MQVGSHVESLLGGYHFVLGLIFVLDLMLKVIDTPLKIFLEDTSITCGLLWLPLLDSFGVILFEEAEAKYIFSGVDEGKRGIFLIIHEL